MPDDLEPISFPDIGRRVSSLGRAGTVRDDGSIEWDERDDAE